MSQCTFKPTDLSAPGAIDQLLAFHRERFGDARMEEPAGGEVGSGAGPGGESSGGNENGFPDKTPVADMKPEEQAAYWKHQARKHEGRANQRGDYDAIRDELAALKAAGQTDAEKAIEEAKTAARTEGETAARQKYSGQLVAAEFKAALAGKRKADEVTTLLEGLDLSKFLTDTGEVDTDKVTNYAAGLAPAGGKWPDTGNGQRGGDSPAKGVSAGADLFAASRGKKTT